MISKTVIIIELFATVAMFANIANAAEGKSASCSCGEITNLLICEDPDDNQICFCNEDGNVYCDKQIEPPAPTPVSAPVVIEPAAPAAPTPAPTFRTIDGCFCDDFTNVLSCDHPLKEEYCFCNEDSNLRCNTDVPPIGSPVYSTPTKEDSVTFPISSFICDDKMEIEHDTVIRVGDSVRVCLLPQDTTGGDLTSIKEIIDVTCSNGMDQAFSIIPISVQDELDHVTFEFSNGAGRGFQTIIKREYTPFSKGYGGVSFACSGSVSLSTTISRRRHRHLVQTTSAVKEAFSLSVNIGNINDENETVTSGYINIAKDIGTNLAYITIIATGLLFL